MTMKAGLRIGILLTTLGWFVLIVGGCHTARLDAELQKAARQIDNIEWYVEKWGTITTSDVLLMENKGQFALNYSQDTKDYVDKAHTAYQGAAGRSLETSLVSQTAVQGTFDLNTLIRDIQSLLPQNASFTVTPPPASVTPGEITTEGENSFVTMLGQGGGQFSIPGLSGSFESGQIQPSSPAITSKLPMDNPAADVLSTPQFTPPLAAPTPPSAISERQALIIGMNDKLTERVLNYLADPKFVDKEYRIALAVFTVTVNPGWKTREGYVAELHMTFDYARDADAKALKPPAGQGSNYVYASDPGQSGEQPTVLAIFPSVEAQTLDLRNSERSQLEMSAYLSALMSGLGAAAQAEQLAGYARRLEYNAATRTPIPVVSSFTDGWGMGYRVFPAFQALADPANKNIGSANVLHEYTFPAVALAIVTEEEMGKWKYIVPHITTRWIPQNRSLQWSKPWRVAFRRPQRESAYTQMAFANEVGRAQSAFIEIENATGDPAWYVAKHRLSALDNFANSLPRATTIPKDAKPVIPPEPPKILDVVPGDGWANADTILTVKGENFSWRNEPIVKSVSVSGRYCAFAVTGKGSMIVTVPKWPENATVGSGFLTVATTAGVDTWTTPITFSRRVAVPGSAPTIDIERDAQGQVTKITVRSYGDVSGDELVMAIKEILSGQDLSTTVRIEVERP